MTKKNNKNTWKKNRRYAHIPLLEDTFYIFCEGEKTETNYFNGFKKEIETSAIYRNKIRVELVPVGARAKQVVDNAIAYVEREDIIAGQIWCVFDKDDLDDKTFNDAIAKCEKLNKLKSNIKWHATWSNQCIELWFILHFIFYDIDSDRFEYYKLLNKEFKKKSIGKYEKNSKTIFDDLIKHGNPKQAIRFAEKLLKTHNMSSPAKMCPATQVHKLVVDIAKYLPETTKNQII